MQYRLLVACVVYIIVVFIHFLTSRKALMKTFPIFSHYIESDEVQSTGKLILYFDQYFDSQWSNSFGPDDPKGLKKQGCPTWNCEFTYDKRHLADADAVLFNPRSVKKWLKLNRTSPEQIWIWIEPEAPWTYAGILREELIVKANFSHNFNWTMTYHSSADLGLESAYLLPKSGCKNKFLPISLKFWNTTTEEYNKKYMEVLRSDLSAYELLGPITEANLSYQEAKLYNKQFINVGEAPNENSICMEDYKALETNGDYSFKNSSNATNTWKSFMDRPKLVAWMSSSCKTLSKREEYVAELQKYISVSTYGICGNLTCGTWHPLSIKRCWRKVFRPNFLFYLSMENTFCDEYITEKVYNPLMHGLVPIVWGGANYSRFLPHHSFIDARKYHPKNLATLLTRLQNNKTEYAKYHYWRKFWTIHYSQTFCELCHKLHNQNLYRKPKDDLSNHMNYKRFRDWRLANEKCIKVPKNLFTTDKWKEYIDDNI